MRWKLLSFYLLTRRNYIKLIIFSPQILGKIHTSGPIKLPFRRVLDIDKFFESYVTI